MTAHDAGAWWDPEILTEDDDLAALHPFPAFERLVASSTQRWTQANAEPDRSGDLLLQPAGPGHGVLVALHGAEEDATDALAAWGSAAEHGFAVHAVRSSQRTSPSYRSWRDHGRAAAEVADARASLPGALQSLPVIAAGFSAGGRVALRWALSDEPYAVAGVIAVAPAITAEQLPPGSRSGLQPAVILVGSEDDDVGDVVVVGRALEGVGVTTTVVPALGHRFPDGFADRLASLLATRGRARR